MQMFMTLSSRNLYKCKHRYLHLLLQSCLYILFTFNLVCLLLDFCLHVYHFFMLLFVVMLSSSVICKQVCLLQCYVFVVCVHNLKVKPCKSKTPAPAPAPTLNSHLWPNIYLPKLILNIFSSFYFYRLTGTVNTCIPEQTKRNKKISV